jgi:hypothetical protein
MKNKNHERSSLQSSLEQEDLLEEVHPAAVYSSKFKTTYEKTSCSQVAKKMKVL